MLKFDGSEKLGLTPTELIFSSRSVRNVTITLNSSTVPPTRLYVIETTGKKCHHPPSTIYKMDRNGQKEHVATLEWKTFSKDQIVLRGERKMLKDVLPKKGFCRYYTTPRLTGEWVWKTRMSSPELFDASGQSIAKYSKHFKKDHPPATMAVNLEAMADLDMVIIGLVCCRQQIRRNRKHHSG